MILLAIDPGPVESAFVFYDTDTGQPTEFGKQENWIIRDWMSDLDRDHLIAIEMIASYGMPVGAEVFQTCVEIGRFIELWGDELHVRVFRRDVKLHLCGLARAKDANIRQALIDRYGGKDRGVGRKANPGPLYGITGDVWAALAVAVTVADTHALELAA